MWLSAKTVWLTPESIKRTPTTTRKTGQETSLRRCSNGVELQYASLSSRNGLKLLEWMSLPVHFEQSCGMPGWPGANESLATPAALSCRWESCVHVPLPAVPDEPSVLP